jgi:hypothetical protein
MIMLAPGTYRGAVRGKGIGSIGDYTLAGGVVPSDGHGCGWRNITPGITMDQMVVPQVDCRNDTGYFDRYAVLLKAGRSYMISATARKIVEVWDRDQTTLVADNRESLDSPVIVTPAENADYRIRVIMPDPLDGSGWRYTLSIR